MKQGVTPASVWLDTADAPLAARVVAELAALGITGAGRPDVPPATCAVALVDVRDGATERLSQWRDRGWLVALADPGPLEALLEAGAHEVVTDPGELTARLHVAVRRPGAPLPPALRRLVRHDLRSPLAVILGQCDLLDADIRGPLTDGQRKAVRAIARQVHRLGALDDELARRLTGPTRTAGEPERETGG